jgi:broad specificity phosphatase PhoE
VSKRSQLRPNEQSQGSVLEWHSKIYGWEVLIETFGSGLAFPSVRLDVIRHGETTLNEKGRVSGSAPDVNLTVLGRHQAQALARLLDPPYVAAFSSTLKRSKLTLKIALSASEINVPKRADPRLGERSLGELEGRRHRLIPEFAEGDLLFAPERGENYLSVTQRCLSFLVDIHRLTRRRRNARVLICTHMGPMRVLKAIAENEHDPGQMMGYSFSNTELLQLNLTKLQWPAFLREVQWNSPARFEGGEEQQSTSFYRNMLLSIRRLRRA